MNTDIPCVRVLRAAVTTPDPAGKPITLSAQDARQLLFEIDQLNSLNRIYFDRIEQARHALDPFAGQAKTQ